MDRYWTELGLVNWIVCVEVLNVLFPVANDGGTIWMPPYWLLMDRF